MVGWFVAGRNLPQRGNRAITTTTTSHLLLTLGGNLDPGINDGLRAKRGVQNGQR